jgi:acetyl esterase/lipase
MTFILLPNICCSQIINNTSIKGRIINPSDKIIRIGDNAVPVLASGEFNFNPDLKSPVFYVVNYGDLYWLIYLEPGKKTELVFTSGDQASLSVDGDLKMENNYLKEIIPINDEINSYLNTRWADLHQRDEAAFISVLDSLKRLFFDPLSLLTQKNMGFSEDFTKLITADINFGMNRLVVQYPEMHMMFTGAKLFLSRETQDYLDAMPFDDIQMLALSNYKSFCLAWIDYKAGLIADASNVKKCFNLKKMDALYQVIPEMFHDSYLSDFWLSEYLNEFVFLNGLANSRDYIKNFTSICKTEEFCARITELALSEEKNRKDHIVKVYKTIDGFKLEAHIFLPDSLAEDEKRPSVVLFHGGGWQTGNPSWMFSNARHFRDLGMVAIAAQYRLGNRKDVTVFDCLDDARDVIKWMRTNAEALHILSDSIVAYGWSAGGHLAISAAIFSDTTDTGISPAPDAAILFSPGIDLPTNISWIVNALGYGADRSSINPVDNVRKGLPPTIILQGRDDTVTPLAGAQMFTDRMNEKGNYCKLVIYDNVGHLFTPNTIPDYNDPQPDPAIMKKASDEADSFLINLHYIKK